MSRKIYHDSLCLLFFLLFLVPFSVAADGDDGLGSIYTRVSDVDFKFVPPEEDRYEVYVSFHIEAWNQLSSTETLDSCGLKVVISVDSISYLNEFCKLDHPKDFSGGRSDFLDGYSLISFEVPVKDAINLSSFDIYINLTSSESSVGGLYNATI